MTISLEVTKVTVLTGDGADKVILATVFPSPLPKVSNQPLSLSFDAEHMRGEQYVRDVLGIGPEIVEVIKLGG